MITAKEARERSDAVKLEHVKQEQKLIEKQINDAVEAGADYCSIDYYTSKTTEDWLKSLGYTVERSQTYGDINVSW